VKKLIILIRIIFFKKVESKLFKNDLLSNVKKPLQSPSFQ